MYYLDTKKGVGYQERRFFMEIGNNFQKFIWNKSFSLTKKFSHPQLDIAGALINNL